MRILSTMDNGIKKTVLVVEDNADMRGALVERFEENNYVVIEAQDAESGLKALKENKVDLILLDLLLPDTSGPVMLKEAKDDTDIDLDSIKIIVLTSLGDVSAVSSVLEGGMYDYFVKSQTSLDEIVDYVDKKLRE